MKMNFNYSSIVNHFFCAVNFDGKINEEIQMKYSDKSVIKMIITNKNSWCTAQFMFIMVHARSIHEPYQKTAFINIKRTLTQNLRKCENKTKTEEKTRHETEMMSFYLANQLQADWWFIASISVSFVSQSEVFLYALTLYKCDEIKNS